MPYCTKCGEEVVEGSSFCQKCGERLHSAQSTPQESPATSPITDGEYAIFIGKNAYKYLQKFKKFGINGTDKFSLTWHWPAFFFPFFWMLYRKLYLWAVLALLLGFVFGIIPYIGFLLRMVLFGMTANYIYYKNIKKKILELKQLQVSPDIIKIELARAGAVNSVAVVIAPLLFVFLVGMVAAIAIPQFSAYRTRAYNSAAQTDLRNVTVAQEQYYVDNGTYTDSIEGLTGSTYDLYLSEGVKVVIEYANGERYMMVAFHDKGNKKYRIKGPGGGIEEAAK